MYSFGSKGRSMPVCKQTMLTLALRSATLRLRTHCWWTTWTLHALRKTQMCYGPVKRSERQTEPSNWTVDALQLYIVDWDCTITQWMKFSSVLFHALFALLAFISKIIWWIFCKFDVCVSHQGRLPHAFKFTILIYHHFWEHCNYQSNRHDWNDHKPLWGITKMDCATRCEEYILVWQWEEFDQCEGVLQVSKENEKIKNDICYPHAAHMFNLV